MAALAILALIIVPTVEIAVFIQVGGAIGLWPTLGLIVATAVAGGLILRQQGLAMLARARETLRRNELPVTEVLHGVCLLLAAAFLLTPGFVTDFLGGLLLLPMFRRLLIRGARGYFEARLSVVGPSIGPEGQARKPGDREGTVIDGEFKDITEKERSMPPPRGDRGRKPQ